MPSFAAAHAQVNFPKLVGNGWVLLCTHDVILSYLLIWQRWYFRWRLFIPRMLMTYLLHHLLGSRTVWAYGASFPLGVIYFFLSESLQVMTVLEYQNLGLRRPVTPELLQTLDLSLGFLYISPPVFFLFFLVPLRVVYLWIAAWIAFHLIFSLFAFYFYVLRKFLEFTFQPFLMTFFSPRTLFLDCSQDNLVFLFLFWKIVMSWEKGVKVKVIFCICKAIYKIFYTYYLIWSFWQRSHLIFEIHRAEVIISVLQIKQRVSERLNDLSEVILPIGNETRIQAGCPGPGLGLVCDKAFGGTENGVWTLTRPLEYRGWGLDTGKSWAWDPSLQCCQGCVSRRWLRPWPSRMLCCGPVGDREQGSGSVSEGATV